jgi:hypothetical protein
MALAMSLKSVSILNVPLESTTPNKPLIDALPGQSSLLCFKNQDSLGTKTKSVINDQQIMGPFGLQEVNQEDGGSDYVRFCLVKSLF